jgi:hypothetical protein
MASARNACWRKKIPSGDHCMSIVNNPLDGMRWLSEVDPSPPPVSGRFIFIGLEPFLRDFI